MLRGNANDQLDGELDDWLARIPGPVDANVEAARQRIGRLARQFERVLAAAARQHDISIGDLETLSVLCRSSTPALTPGEIAETLRITSGTMSVRLRRLLDGGLVEHVAASDRRSRPIRATPAGTRRWADATLSRSAAEAALFTDVLTSLGVEQLNALLRPLLARFEAEYGPAPRHDMTRSGGGRR